LRLSPDGTLDDPLKTTRSLVEELASRLTPW
jgi:hypothetical protein